MPLTQTKTKGGGGCWKHYPNDIKFSFFTFYILAGGILVTSGNNQVHICAE